MRLASALVSSLLVCFWSSLIFAQTPKTGDVFKDCDRCPEMVAVQSGSFSMGSPESEPERESAKAATEVPLHLVTIEKPFAVGRFAVTVDQFAVFVAETNYEAGYKCYAFDGGKWEERQERSWRRPGFPQSGAQPAACLNWYDAKAYVAWLSRKTGKSYRLLTEAEREYVTRAGTTTPFWWGESITTSQANYDGNYTYDGGAKGEYRQRTVPVNSFQPNPFGLYQVHGNVWEWVEDCWNDTYSGAPSDGSAWLSGDCSRRVVRGGSWYGYPQALRAASRSWLSAEIRGNYHGFRLARPLAP
jgi:formylglycine-generating enzyme required for sulfatase activity